MPKNTIAAFAWTQTVRTRGDLAQLRGPHPLAAPRRRKVRIEIDGVPWERAKAW